MSPQFVAAASIIRTEVERITDEYLHVISGVLPPVRCGYQPPAKLRRLRYHEPTVRAAASIIRTEVERITDEYRHVISGVLLPVPLRISATRQVEAFEVS